MDEDNQILKTMLQYYRNKCAQLEFDFVLYKLQQEFKEGQSSRDIQNTSDARKETDSNAEGA
jgi:hypothetical protein